MNRERFIIPPSVLVDQEQLIILTDISYWSEHHDELKQWCLRHNAVVAGMAVVLNSERDLVEFVLKWS